MLRFVALQTGDDQLGCRATITGAVAECTTAELTEPSSIPANPPTSPVTDHHELGGLGLGQQLPSGLVGHDDPADRDIRISLAPAGQLLGQGALGFLAQIVPPDGGELEVQVCPGVKDDEFDAAARRLVECDLGRELRGG
ncbi:hypothetical protein ATO49_05230 [Mycolicibacterium fortuitum subsp. fortuitum DSM 46621 = ATCC 6841 = JCM 6387]|nr:hypothetical protein ATO49_05230 [Mycolicibacterium fortuitum subsp. fortuitum DSM 46621 = ATCC 6841 = JCM 6387]